jgi:hypothetical protein
MVGRLAVLAMKHSSSSSAHGTVASRHHCYAATLETPSSFSLGVARTGNSIARF